MKAISGWGRSPVVQADERLGEDLEELTRGAVLSRGLGRSYGDASLPGTEGAIVACTRLADRILGFDPRSGTLRAEAGLSLARLNGLMLPAGWSSPVLPGTQFVTLGGMVAADVHGKNHHRAGSFGNHVRSMRVRVADGRILEIDEHHEPDLFRATIGGMGLTGHILEVGLRLERVPSPWIRQETEPVADLDAMLERLPEAGASWSHTVCWVDALRRGRGMGRGVLIKGRWAAPDEAPPRRPPARPRVGVPIDMPRFALGRASVRAFNALYRRRFGKKRSAIVHPESFFYPLDALRHWNRLYGRQGFTQYQCVVPAGERAAVRRLFERLTAGSDASFLSVVKDLGGDGRGMLSFPMAGLTLAFDIPLRGARTRKLVDDLNEITAAAGGRIYLAKDTLTRAEHFRAMEPRLGPWREVRRRWDGAGRIASALGDRLLEER